MRVIEVPSYIRALIFDCDGTLVDSMPLHLKAWEHVIKESGGPWEQDFFSSRKGMPERTIVSLYNRHYGLALDPAEIVRTKHRFFWANACELRPIPHVVEVARKHKGILPMAVASGGTRRNVNLQLEAVQIKEFFPVILSADDNVRPKPAPDIFLEAARRLQADPECCQVFEDGDLGLEAARIAGMLATDVR